MKIICVGRNYTDHINEMGSNKPAIPVLFLKPKSALANSNKKLFHPHHTIDWQYEAEIVIKISKNGKRVTAAEAHQYYNQYTIGLDMTARDVQQKLKEQGLPWEMAKAHDGSATVGDFVDIDSSVDVQNLDFELLKNGKIVQEANSSEMLFSVNELLEYISQYFTLNIGDLIFTGTPAGVGSVDPGDVLVGYVEGNKLLDTSIL